MSNTFLLGSYNFNGTLINGRPLYVGESKTYGLWFSGNSNGDHRGWFIDSLSNLKKGEYIYYSRYFYSGEDTNCPMLTSLSQERFNGEWDIIENGHLNCLDRNSNQIWTWTNDRTCNSNHHTWTDNRGFSCQHYLDEDWCTSEGKYGPNWTDRGFFLAYAKDQFTGLNCVQCGCEGSFYF